MDMDINIDWIDNLLYGDINRLKDEIKLVDKSSVLHIIAAKYNWDNGLDVPRIIIENRHCDLGTALMIFYLADGYRMLESLAEFSSSPDNEWKAFLSSMYRRIENTDFNSQNISYTPELSKVQLYKLKKNNPNIPDIFLNKSPGERRR